MSTPQSNIRVFIQWKEQSIFAGEDIECQITFKNVAANPTSSNKSTHPRGSNGFMQSPERHRKAPSQIKNTALNPHPGVVDKEFRRPSVALTAPTSSLPSKQSEAWNRRTSKSGKGGESHGRSLSIISMGVTENTADEVTSHGSLVERPASKSGKGHGRSASLQIVSRRNGINGGPVSAPLGPRTLAQPPAFLGSSFPPNQSLPNSPRRHTAATVPNTPGLGAHFARRKDSVQSSPFSPNFKFPPISPSADARLNTYFEPEPTNHKHQDSKGMLSPRPGDAASNNTEHKAPASIARILSPSSTGGTPRSSGEFYSLSNNSTETLVSEYQPPHQVRMAPYSAHHVKRSSNLAPTNSHKAPETLMMGYAQIHGSFVLDPSLISQAPFEEVKRKGTVGGQGGGVIGVERKRDSGLLRTFGWGSIGESIGGLLGSGELSSMKDMRGMANSRSIPLLSTPQSILFVDLRLAPGESRSYKYSFKLPRGLPPSHRGKAIKTSYKLVIGTQRPGGAKEQQVRSVEIPFRVLGSVNSYGELLGHDLMLPHILLRDQARIQTISTKSDESLHSSKKLFIDTKKSQKLKDASLDDFLAYVDELLTKPRRNSSFGLLSPTDTVGSRRHSIIDEPASAKEAIDMAIQRSNMSGESQQSANRFEIARSGKRVAVVMLARPAYRLGETITLAIDFTDAEIPTYAIHAALETAEKVDQSIALRSEASIFRVTRRVHVSHSESTLFARRIVFSPTIPVTATPEFITSGVALDWKVRIEFVTPRLVGVDGEVRDFVEEGMLLEEISADERGVVLAAVQGLDCESFEIAVPIRVYGALVGGEGREREEGVGGGLGLGLVV